MRRTSLLLLMVALITSLMVLNGCPKKQEPVTPPPAPVETTKPEVKPEPEQPKQPEAKPELREEQLQTVYFDFDKYNLRPDAKSSLDANFALLQQYSNVIIKIEGHCDERGTVEYNLSLGEKRAKSVMDYLTGLGVSASRVTIVSYGKERPLDAGHNETAWAKNRRAEFRVVSQ
ncbi:MAG: peptidoglycan-associated lipoprotein Pal [candidate division Zixibacteria bacterium]|nr:peptidoglycan-associated lipoprotein Pal [candidate division Zixibacteria bacterium]